MIYNEADKNKKSKILNEKNIIIMRGFVFAFVSLKFLS